MNRRKSREIAMKLLFEMTINKEEYREVLENFKQNTEMKLDDVDFEYIIKIIQGVEENIDLIDNKIQENLRNWKLNRISKMNMSILRLAIYEILFVEDVPDKVAVNESIEIAKKYSDDNAPSFINGVLGNMIKK